MGKVIARNAAVASGVAGALDNIDGDLLDDGDLAVVISDQWAQFFYLRGNHGGAENRPYVIPPSINAGTKRWIPAKPAWPSSHVYQACEAAQSIQSETHTTIIFNVGARDTLGEWNATTGTYTAKGKDELWVTATARTEERLWTVGKGCVLGVWKNGALWDHGQSIFAHAANTFHISVDIHTLVPVEMGDTIQVKFYQNDVSSLVLDVDPYINTIQLNGTF